MGDAKKKPASQQPPADDDQVVAQPDPQAPDPDTDDGGIKPDSIGHG
jgi:hypothetical protein